MYWGVPKAVNTSIRLGVFSLFFIIIYFGQFDSVYAVGSTPVTVTLTGASGTSIFGNTVTFNSTVVDSNNGSVFPEGTISFKDGGTTLATIPLIQNYPTATVASGGPPSIPSGMKVACFTNSSSSASASCPVLVLGDFTFWAFSYTDNRNSFGIVQFDSAGNIIRQWEQPGARYLYQLTVNSTAKTVTFWGQDSGTASLNWSALQASNSSAVFSTSTLVVGNHPITAVYSGDALHASNISTEFTKAVNPISTTTALTSNSNPSLIGGAIQYSATVTPDGGSSPSGSVSFYKNGVFINSAVLSGGIATLTVSDLTIGTHPITAVYGGDSTHATSTSSPLTQTVNKASTTTVISNTSSIFFGLFTTYTATVSSLTGTTPSGTVSFYKGGSFLGTGNLLGDRTASFTTVSFLTAGTHSITAVYNGDTYHVTSNSDSLNQTVNRASTSIVINSPVAVVLGSPADLTATVTSSSGTTPTGTVEFLDGGTSLGTANIQPDRTATFTTSSLFVGNHTITAIYSGDNNHVSNQSDPVNQTINKISTTTTLSVVPDLSSYGEAVVYTAIVTPANGPSPTGLVSFYNNGVLIDSVSLSGGTATQAVNDLSVGSHQIAVVYEGNSTHTSSASSELSQTVNKASPNLQLTTSSNSVISGSPVAFSISIPVINSISPNGKIAFKDGSTVLSSVYMEPGGTASFVTDSLAVGTHIIIAEYSGDDNYTSKASTPLTQTVIAKSFVSINSVSSATYRQSVSFTITVSALGIIPTGTLIIKDGDTDLHAASLNSEGAMIYSTSELSVGVHEIKALYSGDSFHTYGISNPLQVNILPHNNASLSGLSLTGANLSTIFQPGITSYEASVTNSVYSVTISPVLEDRFAFAVITANGQTITSAIYGMKNVPIPLNVGTNNIKILITAQDGMTQNAYNINVKRMGSSSTELTNLILNGATLNPSFNRGKTNYSSTVTNSVYSLTIIPVTGNNFATVTVNGKPVINNHQSEPVLLQEGINLITLEVTAQDGLAKQSYSITIFRYANGKVDISQILKQITARFDVNGDGIIDRADVQSLLNQVQPIFVQP